MNEKQFFAFWQEVLSDSNYLLKVPEAERDEDMYLITIERCSSPTFQMSKLKHETLTAIPKEFLFKQMTYSGAEHLVNENIREHIPAKYIALANTLKLEELVPDNLVKNFRDEPVYGIYFDKDENKDVLEVSGYGKTARTTESRHAVREARCRSEKAGKSYVG